MAPKKSRRNRSGEASASEIAALIHQACGDAKAKDITVLDVAEVFSLSDYFVIASGRSDRQVQGITNKIVTTLAEHGIHPIAVEGTEKAHWVLIDFGDVIVHVFYEPARAMYELESLWINARTIDMEKANRSNLRAA